MAQKLTFELFITSKVVYLWKKLLLKVTSIQKDMFYKFKMLIYGLSGKANVNL